MAEQSPIRTATMARIYAQQGHYRKAADIYRHLLTLDPSRQDIADALAAAETMQAAEDHGGEKGLAPLVREWIRLAVRYRQVQQLKRMKNSLSAVKAGRPTDH